MRREQVLAALVGITIIGMTVVLSLAAPNPGVLSSFHSSVMEDAGILGCDVCHTADGLSNGCVGCHNEIEEQHIQQKGYHFALLEQGLSRCEDCHGEHYGVDFALINQNAWQGIKPDDFIHSHTEFGLHGAHDEISCDDCHQPVEFRASTFELTREKTFLGLDQQCQSCHEDVHGASIASTCNSCHDQSHFVPASLFDHGEVFPLLGAHQTLDCALCHSVDAVAPALDVVQSTSFDVGSSRYLSFPTLGQDCADCHRNPHDSPNEGVFGNDCGACHTPSTFHEQTFDLAKQHGSFPLLGDHANASCNSCHRQAQQSIHGLKDQDCAACHQNPHQTKFQEGCADCHRPISKEFFTIPSTEFKPIHLQTGFALDAPHDEASCDQCHSAVASFQERFPGRTATECAACHDDPHGGQFEARTQNCTDCHETHRFQPTTYDVSNHQPALLGNHRAVACSACHRVDELTGVRKFVGTATACASCHQNPHGSQFNAEMNEAGCSACHHSFETWTQPEFNHDAIGYKLVGAHADASCQQCHLKGEDNHSRRYRGTPTACNECHRDPHHGQLTLAQGGDCQRCHQSFLSWDRNVFDHNRHSRFSLTGEHEGVACHRCHPLRTAPDGSMFVYYKPIGVECRVCHEAR